MNTHIALYKWKPEARPEQIKEALVGIESLAVQIPGIVEISTGKNTSKYSDGYSHVILVRAKTQAAIDAYRKHPEHIRLAKIIETMEQQGIGVDFETSD